MNAPWELVQSLQRPPLTGALKVVAYDTKQDRMKDNEAPQPFRLIACDADGVPCEQVGTLKQTIKENCEGTAALYRQVGFTPPWIGYLACFQVEVVGGGAFVGAPTQNRVEIAYFTPPEHEGKGLASRTVDALVGIAMGEDPFIEVFAKTLPVLNASTMILSKLGFRNIGCVADDDIGEAWGWLLEPPTLKEV